MVEKIRTRQATWEANLFRCKGVEVKDESHVRLRCVQNEVLRLCLVSLFLNALTLLLK